MAGLPSMSASVVCAMAEAVARCDAEDEYSSGDDVICGQGTVEHKDAEVDELHKDGLCRGADEALRRLGELQALLEQLVLFFGLEALAQRGKQLHTSKQHRAARNSTSTGEFFCARR